MQSKKQGFETVRVDGTTYLFKADFSFLAELKEITGVDPFQIYAQINAGEADPVLVLGILQASIHSIGTTEIDPGEKDLECQKIITLKGLQECHLLAKLLLSWGMIGDEKKRELRRWGTTRRMLKELDVSHWMNSCKVQLLWGLTLMNFGTCAWLIFKM